jgi:hypothetical protein
MEAHSLAGSSFPATAKKRIMKNLNRVVGVGNDRAGFGRQGGKFSLIRAVGLLLGVAGLLAARAGTPVAERNSAAFQLAAAETAPKAETKATADAGDAKTAKTKAADSSETGGQSLFDGKTLKGWKSSDFAGHGEVRVENGQIIMDLGNDMTGITYTNDMPKINYEVNLDAMRVDGSDFFCGLTFPVKDEPCSLIIGGWGGGVVGLSSLEGNDASSNETTTYLSFDTGRWYHVRLRVTEDRIDAWIDKKQIVKIPTKEHKFSIRIEVEESKPFGIATWRTKGAVKNLTLKRLEAGSDTAK